MTLFPRLYALLAAFALLLCAGSAAGATGFEPVQSIRDAALSVLVDRSGAEATLDPALRMPRCGEALQARRIATGTVEVTCASGWRLFVPVRVNRSQQVLVLARGVAGGEAIGADMFEVQERDPGRIAGAAVADPADAIGRVARRGLAAGSVLTAGDLVSPRLVRRGDSIALVSRQHGVEVRMAGRALGDAGERERVSAENLSSRRVIQGVVDASGDVIVGQ